MLAIPPFGASSNIALWRADNKPPLEVVVANLGKATVIVCKQGRGNFSFFIKRRAKRSFSNALSLEKTKPPEKFLPESPFILLFYGCRE